mmetsp:Transcript_22015/g.42233  ORF Transcript_22015/g.42233 Transcript_22015/m.42233 type:complete len:106 (-) Transcript_22015:7-324(-)
MRVFADVWYCNSGSLSPAVSPVVKPLAPGLRKPEFIGAGSARAVLAPSVNERFGSQEDTSWRCWSQWPAYRCSYRSMEALISSYQIAAAPAARKRHAGAWGKNEP